MKNVSLDWAKQELKKLGYDLQCDSYCFKEAPWSTIYVLPTHQGKCFLKISPPPFNIEAQLIQKLKNDQCQNIPKLLGINLQNNAFIMLDDGFSLRHQLKRSYHPQYAIQGLTLYQKIQSDSILQIDSFLNLGVPDWRLHNFPKLLTQLLHNKILLMNDGLSEEEIELLSTEIPHIHETCQKIDSFPIPATLEHGDFHDNNILINNQLLTIHDWGDAVISHPFFSLISFLWSAKRNHSLPKDILMFIEDAYLERWTEYCSYTQLKEIYECIKYLNPLKFSLSFSRISSCHPQQDMGDYKGHIADALRYFLLKQQNKTHK